MSKSYLQITNDVLRLLREDTVSTVDENSYSALIGVLVNQVKQEIEDSWNWTQLRSSILVTTEAGTFNYELTGAGLRSRMYRDKFGRPAVYNLNECYWIRRVESSRWITHQLLSTTGQEKPMYFDFNGRGTDDPQVDLYPIPDGQYTISFNLVIPQAELEDDSDTTVVPPHVIVYGAWARAISERGEDGGANFNEADARYRNELATAIAFDASQNEDELTAVLV